MNSGEKPTNLDPQRGKNAKSRALVILLASLVGLESLFVLAGALYFFSQLFVQEVSNVAGAIVIFAITLLIALGLAIASIGTFREQAWTKGAIVTWQILQFAAATSFIPGISEWQSVGWTLATLSILTIVLVMIVIVRSSREEKL
ncbi:hypothetical protein [Aurantimicrobium sp. MWH-Uga1]|uniref:hypothetical protein n=1 Tax=Aurantimicrobium sp. MWH-Uga1 TaxID=2079575 RepID=UPI000DEDC17E|nr:hypothetical protein [Aurantimicrobium sp. MWH-Uga1]AXE54925.1 hypothetical protein AURUGA1_01249 [Aurantimicrobium sp. MWH-Uga1]